MSTRTPDKSRPTLDAQQQTSGGESSPTSTTPETTSMPQQPPDNPVHASTTNPPVETFNIQRDEDKNRTTPLKSTKDYFKWQKTFNKRCMITIHHSSRNDRCGDLVKAATNSVSLEDEDSSDSSEYYSDEETGTTDAGAVDPCLMKIDPGDIQVAVGPQTRWAYNAVEHRCQTFQFIRGGNANNFATEEDCGKMCRGH
uniref:BPTI/Kunitz inhibitor domain-containing protein n=1 Tax=Romanomermis culicivorax TaxID=13658 RepID=A0A915JY39_ROMCU